MLATTTPARPVLDDALVVPLDRLDHLLFRVFADIFRSHDMGGFAKALWAIFVISCPGSACSST